MGFPYACFSAHTSSSSSSSHRVQSTHSLFRDLICRLLCVLRFCHSVLLAHIYIYLYKSVYVCKQRNICHLVKDRRLHCLLLCLGESPIEMVGKVK